VLEQDRAPALFNLVFGEGIVNDATTVAVLRTVQARPCSHANSSDCSTTCLPSSKFRIWTIKAAPVWHI